MTALTRPWDVDVFCFHKKFLVYNLVSRNLKIKYRRSFLGLFWTLLGPILTSVIYFYVFKIIMRTSTPHYLVYILSGILPWTYFATTVSENMDGIVGNQSLISKVPIPIQVFPYAGCLTNLVSLILSFPIVVAVAVFEHVTLAQLLYFPLALALLFLETYALSLLLAIAYVFVRDLKHALSFVLQIMLYGTPIFYELKMVPETLRWIVFLNPVALPILMIRESILPEPQLFTPAHLLAAFVWTGFLLALATVVVSRNARSIAERI